MMKEKLLLDKKLVEDIDELRVMKDVRNNIVHEYIEDELTDIFEEVLEYTSKLIHMIQNTLAYMERYSNQT